ncbi:MAG: PilZ domain-containing protein [Treponema sp.]|jgi:hypothetical protein|nr:PilZ domain-containing protein [Treponema sp.]
MVLQFSGLYRLQTYFKKDDPQSALFFFIAAGSALVISIILRRILRAAGILSSGSGSAPPAGRFSAYALYRAIRSYGLNREQVKMLKFVFKNGGVTHPEWALSDPVLLDKYFKEAYWVFKGQKNEVEAQIQTARLFSTRNAIEFAQSAASGKDLPRVTAGMMAVLTSGGAGYPPVKVLSARGDYITVECPTTALGTPIKISKGAKIMLSFFTRTSRGFSIASQVRGVSSTYSAATLDLIRVSKPRNLVQRRFRRRQVGIFCYVHPVKIEETGTGRKKNVRMIVERRRFTGTMQDISIGGCAMKTNAAVAAGSRVKIEFDYGGSEGVAVLGQVLRFNQNGSNMVMHTKFLKVPRKAMNAINVAVFDYLED